MYCYAKVTVNIAVINYTDFAKKSFNQNKDSYVITKTCDIPKIPIRLLNRSGIVECTGNEKDYFNKYIDCYDFNLNNVSVHYINHEIIQVEMVTVKGETKLIDNKTIQILKLLPKELSKQILSFISPEDFMSNETKLMKNVISVYNIDHDPDLTKQAKMYYIKNIMSFNNYVFATLYDDSYCDEGCIYGKATYDTLELDDSIKKRIKDVY